MLHQDFKDMLSALSNESAEFLVVGAHALAAHGYLRATGDIDILVKPTKVNAKRVLMALKKFGAPLHGTTAEELCDSETVVQLGVVPVRIDILSSISGVTFSEAWRSRVKARFAGIAVFVPSLEILEQNKRATGRAKDLADVEVIASMRAEKAPRKNRVARKQP